MDEDERHRWVKNQLLTLRDDLERTDTKVSLLEMEITNVARMNKNITDLLTTNQARINSQVNNLLMEGNYRKTLPNEPILEEACPDKSFEYVANWSEDVVAKQIREAIKLERAQEEQAIKDKLIELFQEELELHIFDNWSRANCKDVAGDLVEILVEQIPLLFKERELHNEPILEEACPDKSFEYVYNWSEAIAKKVGLIREKEEPSPPSSQPTPTPKTCDVCGKVITASAIIEDKTRCHSCWLAKNDNPLTANFDKKSIEEIYKLAEDKYPKTITYGSGRTLTLHGPMKVECPKCKAIGTDLTKCSTCGTNYGLIDEK